MPVVLRVALPVPLPTLFDYLPPAAGEAGVGSRVLVPFGRNKLVGVVVAIEVEAAVDDRRLKQVLRLLDDGALLDPELMQTLAWAADYRSEEHTSELQSLMRSSYAVFCLKKKKK